MAKGIALISLIVLFPVFLILLMVQIWVFPRVFFTQVRVGKNNVKFNLFKLQTLKNGSSINITSWGKFLRSSSLDEVPQLFNILKGDMNFVGPRPLLPEYLPLYSEQQARRHEVKPGLTGWAQVNGRNNLTWKQQFELDVWYVDNRSFWLDVKIIVLTILKIFSKNKGGTKMREAFSGNN